MSAFSLTFFEITKFLVNERRLALNPKLFYQSPLHTALKITAALMGEPSLYSRFFDPPFTVLCCFQADLSSFFEPSICHAFWLTSSPPLIPTLQNRRTLGFIMVSGSTLHSFGWLSIGAELVVMTLLIGVLSPQ